MKNWLFFVLALVFTSCSDDESDNTIENGTEIIVSTSSVNFDYAEGQKILIVNATDEWRIYSSEDWCSVNPNSGLSGETDVTVSVSENQSDKPRTAELTIKSGTYKKYVTINQHYFVQIIDFSDTAFENFCVDNFDTDGDDSVSTEEVATIKSLDVSGLGISNLDGIEYFISLETLDCSNNEIDSLNLTNNHRLVSLNCSSNNLTELDIQLNVNLSELNCADNSALTSIYVWTGFSPTENFQKPENARYIEPEIATPAGYALVWQDEFNESSSDGKALLPDENKWWYETGDNGWGNNEIQNYIPGVRDADTCAMVYDGSLKIIAKKSGSEVLSIRMNSTKSWKYGYFEARLNLPGGKGTWPAFWMLPENFTAWPDDGEIDIMEEVGYRPNWVSSSIHCSAYNHANGTQKTAEKYVETAESEFHVYAVEWTEDYIYGYVDGVRYFEFYNDHVGNYDTWPFNQAFYLKLNLAWGGNWGGAEGVDESVLPAVYEIDYVRVFQKVN